MLHKVTLAACALLLAAAPGWAGTFKIYEDSRGGPGVTAGFPHGTGLLADIDFNADTAEGGGLLTGASEIEIRPLGSVDLVDFTCELPGCTLNSDYVFTPGTAGENAKIVITDGDPNQKNGIYDLGTIEFDAPSGAGSIQLVTCNYTGLDFQERTCDPFTLVSMPEPGFGVLFAAGAALLFGPLRRLRLRSAPVR